MNYYSVLYLKLQFIIEIQKEKHFVSFQRILFRELLATFNLY